MDEEQWRKRQDFFILSFLKRKQEAEERKYRKKYGDKK
jgi:hypothetical protein